VASAASAASANLVLKCFNATDLANFPTALGFADNVGATHTQISNLPGDPIKAVQYDKAEIHFNVSRISVVPASCSPQTIDSRARNVGLHEMGHVAGFGHFTTGLMQVNASCTAIRAFPSTMQAALLDYSGSASSANIVEDNLESMGL
jgi:hypothetical protein